MIDILKAIQNTIRYLGERPLPSGVAEHFVSLESKELTEEETEYLRLHDDAEKEAKL